MIHFDINYLSIFVAAIARMVIGSFWYSPLLFGKAWEKLTSVRTTDPAKMATMSSKISKPAYFGSFISTLFMAFVLANVLIWTGSSNALSALQISFYMWIGFIAPVGLTTALFNKKPMMLFAIDYIHQLIVILAMAAILVTWP